MAKTGRSYSVLAGSQTASVRKTFDFSAIHQSMVEIKRSLWEVDRRETSFKRHMNILHTDFANKIIVRKKE